MLLLFLGRQQSIDGWFRLGLDGIVERGEGMDMLPPLVSPEGDAIRIAAIAPAEDVSLHWLDLPSALSAPQAYAAARLMASDLVAQPLDEVHVAAGPGREEGEPRCVAIASSARMADWLLRCQAVGVDPDIIIPESLLLPVPELGLAVHERDGMALYRGAAVAFGLEKDLASRIIREGPMEPVDAARLEAGLLQAVDDRPVDLRQGIFAKRRRRKIDWPLVHRLAVLAAAILLVTLAIQAASILRYTFAADEAEAEAVRVAASVLPPGTNAENALRRLEARSAATRGDAIGYSTLISALFSALQSVPGANLVSLTFDARGGLRASISSDSPAGLTAVQQQLEANGLLVQSGPVSRSEGRHVSELGMRPK